MVEAMEPSTMEPSKETLWQWHLGLISILLFLFGAVSFYDSKFVPSDIFDVPIDYDPRVPNIIEAIPYCIHSCLIPRITDLGCAHLDYTCFCRNFHLLEDDSCVPLTDGEPSFEACATQCNANQGLDLQRSPGLILDLCDTLDEPVVLPAFMAGMIKIYGRQISSSSSVVFLPQQTSTVTETLPWGENPQTFPSRSFDGSRFIVFVADTSISTFFSTATLGLGETPYTSTVTAQNSPAVTDIIWVAQKTTGTTTSNPTTTNTMSVSTGRLSPGAKAGIGIGVAVVVVLLAVGFIWFIIVHRRKSRSAARLEVQREKHDSGLPEHISAMDEIGLDYTPGGRYYRSPVGTVPQEVEGTQVHKARYVLPAASNIVGERHELQESNPATQRSELGTEAKTPISKFSELGVQSNIQRKAVSPSPASFPPPWATSPQQGNHHLQEHSRTEQPQETSKTTATEMVVEPDEHDPELRLLEDEIAKVRVERERLQRLQDLEVREAELKRNIEERRKRGGGLPG